MTQEPKLKDYKDVVTKDAKTQTGVFKVHEIGPKVLWEIPQDMYGRVFLWQTEIAGVPSGEFAYSGLNVGNHMVTFERRDNYIFVREQNYNMRTNSHGSMAIGVGEANVAPIVEAIPVEAESDDKAAVVDVTKLFTTDKPFPAGTAVGSTGVDGTRSYIDKVSDFPTNIETRSLLTFSSPSSKTVLVHYSLDLLPQKPMMPRYRDDRVGFFGTSFSMYGSPKNKVVDETYIDRFRLEKKDPGAAISEPVKPITFYLSREVPDKFRPALKKAVEDWNVAFEKAGFKNAIVCKNAPSVQEDPNWDPEDARYSVIRWVASPTENAMGPHVADPRSGETLSAHIIVWHNVLNLVQNWYFTQASAVDPSARHLPLPDSLMDRLIEYVVCHEVGHTLGLEHNFKASTAWTVQQLRTPGFVAKNGVAASIMSYSRFNYVAQPSDHLTEADMIGKIGPYDKFAIAWGYTPISGAHNPDEEKPTLDKWAAQQIAHPELQFGNYMYSEDPTTQSECIASDPIQSGMLGLANLNREAAYLLQAATTKGDNYDDLKDLYDNLLSQRFTELYRATRYVGGVVETNYHAGHGNLVFKPVPKQEQADAVAFIVRYGLNMPPALMDRNVLDRIYPDGNVDRVVGRAGALVAMLLSDDHASRILDNEAANGNAAYTLDSLASDLQNGVFSELNDKHVSIGVYRRALQLRYLQTIDARINGSNATKTELNGIERDDLRALAFKADHAASRSSDQATKRHLQDVRRIIGLIVDGKYSPTVVVQTVTQNPGGLPRRRGDDLWPGAWWSGADN